MYHLVIPIINLPIEKTLKFFLKEILVLVSLYIGLILFLLKLYTFLSISSRYIYRVDFWVFLIDTYLIFSSNLSLVGAKKAVLHFFISQLVKFFQILWFTVYNNWHLVFWKWFYLLNLLNLSQWSYDPFY